MVTEIFNLFRQLSSTTKKYLFYIFGFFFSIFIVLFLRGLYHGSTLEILLSFAFLFSVIGIFIYTIIVLIKKIPFSKLFFDEPENNNANEGSDSKKTKENKNTDEVHKVLEQEGTGIISQAMKKLKTFGILMLTIALFFLLLGFIGLFQNSAPKLTQNASHTATGTIMGLLYGIKNGYNAQKNLDKINTGDYVPGQATTEGVTVTPGSSEKGSWLLYEIPIKKGFATRVNIKKPGADKYSITPEGMILYASKPGNVTPDVVINTSESFNLPQGEYYFSAEKDFIQNGTDSCIIQIWAWEKYNK